MRAKSSWLLLLLLAGPLWADEQDRPDVRPLRDFRGHRAPVKHLAFTPDGEQLVSSDATGRLYVWRVADGHLLRQIFPREKEVSADTITMVHQRETLAMAVHPRGKLVAESATEPTLQSVVRLWEIDSGECRRVLLDNQRQPVRALAFTPDGRYLVCAQHDEGRWSQRIVFYDTRDYRPAFSLTAERLSATGLVVSRDGKLLAACSPRRLYIWDIAQRELLHTIKAHEKVIESIAFAPNGRMLVSGSRDDTVRVWNTRTGKQVLKIDAKQDGVLAVAFSPSGRTIASGGRNHTVKLWKPKSGKLRWRLWGHLKPVTCVAFSPDGQTLASGSRDTVVALWKNDEPADEKDEEDEEDKADWMD